MERLWGGKEGRLGPRNDLGRLNLVAQELCSKSLTVRSSSLLLSGYLGAMT